LKKIAIFILIVLVIFLIGLIGHLMALNTGLKRAITELDMKKEAEFKSRLKQEKELVKRDLDEKYRADMVSFEALAKRLEIEKKRLKQTEEELKNLKSTTHP